MKILFRRLAKYLVSVVLMLYSFTVGMFTRKGQYLHSLICSYYGFAFLKPRLPNMSWEALLVEEPLALVELTVEAGNMPIDELALICSIVRKEQPRGIFEIGTMNGRTTLNMALNAPENCRVFTLDLSPESLGQTRYTISKRYQRLVEKERSGDLFLRRDPAALPARQKIVQLWGDSGTFDFSQYYQAVDLVFIDGSHDYDYVLNDSEVALKLLRNGRGVVIWHDYREGIPVVKALETFRRRHPHLAIYHIKDTDFAYLKL